MKQGSMLDGYATMDLHQNKNDRSSPGNARILLQFDIKRNYINNIKVMGIVDTHGEINLKYWNSIPSHEQKSYLRVQNAKYEDVGVKLVNTNEINNGD